MICRISTLFFISGSKDLGRVWQQCSLNTLSGEHRPPPILQCVGLAIPNPITWHVRPEYVPIFAQIGMSVWRVSFCPVLYS